MPKEEDDDNLYYKIYGAGVIFVVLSLFFQGCLFYQCSSGQSNFGSSLYAGSNPKHGKFFGKFNETWQCEDACVTATPPCYSFTFLTYGAVKDPLNGQCYGGLSQRWDPVPITRKTGSAISGSVSPFSAALAPLAALASSNGAPFGKIVGTVTEIREAVKVWPLFAAVRNQLMAITDDKSRSDLWGLLYVLLLSWPLIHLILIDRSNYNQMLSSATEKTQQTAKMPPDGVKAKAHSSKRIQVHSTPDKKTHKASTSLKSVSSPLQKVHPTLKRSASQEFLGLELPQIDLPDIGKEINNLLSLVSPTPSPEKASTESAKS